jgi:uncharacterized phage protein gp47/JayE
MADSLASLLLQQTQAAIYSAALSIATTLGLPVSSWLPGDPTRSLLYVESTFLEQLEQIVVGFIQSGFLDYASIPNADGSTNPWLAILAKQMFNVDVPGATYAETSVTLTNSGGGLFDLGPGDVTLKNSTTGATYHSTSGGVLNPGGTLTIDVVADVAGAAGSAAATEIDTVVTGLLGVTCSNPAAAVGIDEQSPQTTVAQCRAKLGSLSPNGPASAYSYVALNPALTGTANVTRARVYSDSDTGDVTIYVAGPSGAVAGGDVTAVQNAIEKWAAPLCITPTVVSASAVTVAVTYTIWLYQSVNADSTTIQNAIQTALEQAFAERPIGGDIIPPATTGALYASLIQDVIGDVYPGQTFRVAVSLPSGDVALGNGDVPELGVVTGTVNLIPDPL